MEPLGLAFYKCRPRVVVDGAAWPRIFQVLPARGSGWSRLFQYFPQVPPARGSGSDMEPLGLSFSKCRPRVVVDRTWSRLVSHFQSAGRAW